MSKKQYILSWDEIPLAVDCGFVAQMWRCSTQTVYNLCNSGELPCFRVGKRLRITKQALIDYTGAKVKEC